LHEPPLLSGLEHPEEVEGILRPLIEERMAKGGPRAAMEAFVSFAAGESIRSLPQPVIERMLTNGEIFFGLEVGTFESWRPDEQRLRALSIPVRLLVGGESPPFFGEASSWIAERVGSDIVRTPGGHVAMIDKSRDFEEVVRLLIRSMTTRRL
jgi:pimeloyl-ACP methyl ester carboxylesterase